MSFFVMNQLSNSNCQAETEYFYLDILFSQGDHMDEHEQTGDPVEYDTFELTVESGFASSIAEVTKLIIDARTSPQKYQRVLEILSEEQENILSESQTVSLDNLDLSLEIWKPA